jgi:2-keto-4-pentenoate hydratase/2-oxohepta-3-ene-1,7-dioic acid hydratase in catechol pathway
MIGTANNRIDVGAGMNPPKYLSPGTQMGIEISQIGTLRNIVTFAQ